MVESGLPQSCTDALARGTTANGWIGEVSDERAAIDLSLMRQGSQQLGRERASGVHLQMLTDTNALGQSNCSSSMRSCLGSHASGRRTDHTIRNEAEFSAIQHQCLRQ
jgi:hypothetical protein